MFLQHLTAILSTAKILICHQWCNTQAHKQCKKAKFLCLRSCSTFIISFSKFPTFKIMFNSYILHFKTQKSIHLTPPLTASYHCTKVTMPTYEKWCRVTTTHLQQVVWKYSYKVPAIPDSTLHNGKQNIMFQLYSPFSEDFLMEKFHTNSEIHYAYTRHIYIHTHTVLYNILLEFSIPMKLVVLIKMCLNEICSTVWAGKDLSHVSYQERFVKRRSFNVIGFQLCFRICH